MPSLTDPRIVRPSLRALMGQLDPDPVVPEGFQPYPPAERPNAGMRDALARAQWAKPFIERGYPVPILNPEWNDPLTIRQREYQPVDPEFAEAAMGPIRRP